MNKKLTTFEREMKDEKFKKAFDKSYKGFLLTELIISLRERNDTSIDGLMKEILNKES